MVTVIVGGQNRIDTEIGAPSDLTQTPVQPSRHIAKLPRRTSVSSISSIQPSSPLGEILQNPGFPSNPINPSHPEAPLMHEMLN